MKKGILVAMTVVTVVAGAWFTTPQSPDHYEMHHVKYGETVEGIIIDANQNSDVKYDVRDAVSIAISESKKMEGGATSRQIKPGDRIAVPIYR